MLLGPHCNVVMAQNGNEVASHGDEAFPIRGFDETVSTEPGDNVPWHWHADFEAILCVEGEMDVSVGEETIALAPGDAVFVNANRPHAVETDTTGRLRSVVFGATLVSGARDSAIDLRYVQPVANADGLNMLVFHANEASDSAAVRHLAQAVDALEEEAAGFEICVRDHVSQLMLEIWKRAGSSKKEQKQASLSSERAALMSEYIAEHFAEPVAVSDIADAAGVSEREALRCFTREFGVSPSRYLMMKRLARAAELLAGTYMPVAEVARAVGIQSPSNFAQLFRRDYHCTPREYRTHTRE